MQFSSLLFPLLGASLVSAGCKTCLGISGTVACVNGKDDTCLVGRISSNIPFGWKICCDDPTYSIVSCNKSC
ncbi:hypothetical protein CGMCC3_g12350 [Colletotrichum fructicola]|nr:uncharacterized protein CGMCC3_g12350 [Colletotrichum fructicola]KAE9571472.1 hypothetical protein CGMCC3_g12350 [Colletotrichum fructicola]